LISWECLLSWNKKNKLMRYILFILILFIFSAFAFSKELNESQFTKIARQATVKIIKTYIIPDYCSPWKMKGYNTAVGSGAIIKGKLILTNAHVISDSTFIQVQKENDPVSYEAEVVFAGHDCDLALLRVKDEKFFIGTISLDFGKIPALRSTVTTYGYPVGGERISITEGIVSRIEVGLYSHSKKAALLMIQTDAAINPGNSGGPVIQNGKIAGIAFQAIADSSNIGYMIPTPIIQHFLDDVKDGRYDGFPDLGIITENLQNHAYRDFLGMSRTQTGVIVTHVLKGFSAENLVKKGDVVLSIDKQKIANDGTIAYGDGRILFSIVVDQKQIGETVTLEVLREKHIVKIQIPAGKVRARIPWFDEFETRPEYYIFAGIVFQPLNREFLKCWDKWWYKADRKMLYYYLYHDRDNIYPERSQFIFINQVLPDEVNSYVSDINDLIVDKINGIKITNLSDVIEACKKPQGIYHIIETEGNNKPVIIKASDAVEANKRILKKYEISTDRSMNN
jgi:S1-C subfamily serine protease